MLFQRQLRQRRCTDRWRCCSFPNAFVPHTVSYSIHVQLHLSICMKGNMATVDSEVSRLASAVSFPSSMKMQAPSMSTRAKARTTFAISRILLAHHAKSIIGLLVACLYVHICLVFPRNWSVPDIIATDVEEIPGHHNVNVAEFSRTRQGT